jgi:parvulin-like peptidyl-prolyl isomerase
MKLFATLLCLTSPLLAEQVSSDSSVIATVGDSSIRLSEVRDALQKLDVKDQALLGKDSSALNQIVRVLLVQRLMLAEAKAKNWEDKPEVKAALQRAHDTALAENYLQSVSVAPEGYPSEVELKEAYEKLKPSLATPKQWRLAQIYIAAPPGIGKDELAKAEAKLDGIKRQLAEKVDFSKIAQVQSDDAATATQGGEIGWMAETGIVSEIRTQATLLVAGELTPPIRIKDGWHIVKCLELREAATPKLVEVQDSLRLRLREERVKTNSQAYVAQLLKENPVAINEIALKEVLKKP